MEKPLSINSKNRIDQVNREGNLMNQHIVHLIRERFYPLVRFCGPQSAGEVEIEGVRGTVYLGELSIWLWPAKSSHNGVLSDGQLGDVSFATFAGSQSAVVGAGVDAVSVMSPGQDRSGRRRHRVTAAVLPRRFRCNGGRWDGPGTDTRSADRRDQWENS